MVFEKECPQPCFNGCTVYDQCQNNLDDNKITCGVFINLPKAFDTVNHSILLTKLDHYGIRENALHLIQSYLKNRVQFVQIDNHVSMNKTIMCGVPQGNVLGPILFLLYVNDIQNVTNCEDYLQMIHYYTYLIKTLRLLKKNVNAELSKVQQWLDVNKLSLNISKTKYIITSPQFTEKHIYQIKFKENLLSKTENYKYLSAITV